MSHTLHSLAEAMRDGGEPPRVGCSGAAAGFLTTPLDAVRTFQVHTRALVPHCLAITQSQRDTVCVQWVPSTSRRGRIEREGGGGAECAQVLHARSAHAPLLLMMSSAAAAAQMLRERGL